MHIPDGFISPKMYLPAFGVAAGLWAYGIRRVKKTLNEEMIPQLAVLTAFSFVLMLIMLPLPGGTSAHATGIGILAVIFGVWISFLSLSLVLLLQALLLGGGGVTSLPLNALAMGFVGCVVASFLFRLLRRANRDVALFLAGWFSVNAAAFFVAVVLGVQPSLAHESDGTPLFFPFGLAITIPAVMIPHAIIGVGEGILTVLLYRLFSRLRGRT